MLPAQRLQRLVLSYVNIQQAAENFYLVGSVPRGLVATDIGDGQIVDLRDYPSHVRRSGAQLFLVIHVKTLQKLRILDLIRRPDICAGRRRFVVGFRGWVNMNRFGSNAKDRNNQQGHG
ncbi:MAG: hypothetical protein HY403_11385 [Elusimicrobia bacterium]|nr:hypothetical protein [Elusimicrobiota bacterium]